MKLITTNVSAADGALVIKVPDTCKAQADKLLNALRDGRPLEVKIDVYYEARTLRQNNMFWGMLAAEAQVLRTTSWELYIKALEDYGPSFYTLINPDDFDKEEGSHRIVRKRGSRFVNGYKFDVIQIWDGSSKFNRAEMSRFIDGIIDDCKELGVEFLTPKEKALLLEDYYRK